MIESNMPASYIVIDINDEHPGVDKVMDCLDIYERWGRDAFDVVVSAEMMEHAEDWKGCLLNMVAVLRPGGVLVITTRSPGFGYHCPPDHWRYTQKMFADAARELNLEIVVLMDDPEFHGVFVKLRKPENWQPPIAAAIKEPLARIEAIPMREPLKILGLPHNPDGCGYYRFWQPFNQMAMKSDHWVVIPKVGQHVWTPDEEQVEEFDVVARQRPWGKPVVRQLKHWKQLTKLVYETDDNTFEADPSSLPHLLDDEIHETVKECMQLSDLVVASTEPLAEVIRKRVDTKVVVVPNYIHEDVLTIPAPENEKVVLCWAGGANHLQDLMMVQEPLNDVLAGDVDWHMLGVDYRPIFKDRGRFTNWCVDIWDYYKAIDGDIGVIPLRDTAFNRCRTPIKALEYAARGIPSVASDIEPYREFIVDGETGYLVRTEEEWRKRLTELINDRAARIEMGAKAKRVAAHWTIQKGYKRWVSAYEEVAGYEREG